MTLEELYKLKKELLYHVVGMDYRMKKALEIEKEIEQKEKELKLIRKENKDGNDRK